MLTFFIGLVLGWLLTNVAQGAINGRYHYRFDDGVYKDITESMGHCPHDMEAKQKVNGVSMAACAHCTAVFVKVSDLHKVNYE